MRLPSVPPAALSDCATCHREKHPDTVCRCGHDACLEPAVFDVRRGANSRCVRPRCELHLRYELTAAERFGEVVCVQAFVRTRLLV